MRIKKYIARSMREALLQIKEELGEEAIILKTRKLPKKVFGIAGQEEIEVTAAVDEEAAAKRKSVFPPLQMNDLGVYDRRPRSYPRPPPEKPAALSSQKSSLENLATKRSFTATHSVSTPQRAAVSPTGATESKKEILELKENVRELKDLVKSLISNGTNPKSSVSVLSAGWEAVITRLTDSEVRESLAKRLVSSIQGSGFVSDVDFEKKIAAALSTQFPVSGPLKLKKNGPLIVAFVGPTGSGKTTTLAKLAAHCCLNKGKRVSIITADTYRIAAIEQIRMFADIVKVGLQVVFSPEEICTALKGCQDDEVVFIDTAGRSQRNSEHMQELREMMSVLRPDETHLVLSATTKDSDLLENITLYRPLGVNRLIFTKLDETVRLGNIYNVVCESAVPISYFTFGQSVPDDIELAQPGKFVQRLMEGRTL